MVVFHSDVSPNVPNRLITKRLLVVTVNFAMRPANNAVDQTITIVQPVLMVNDSR